MGESRFAHRTLYSHLPDQEDPGGPAGLRWEWAMTIYWESGDTAARSCTMWDPQEDVELQADYGHTGLLGVSMPQEQDSPGLH